MFDFIDKQEDGLIILTWLLGQKWGELQWQLLYLSGLNGEMKAKER